jgi:STE24 endopeptidase
MLPSGALLVHCSLAAVCWSATRLVARAAGPSPVVARRVRRVGAFLALLLAAGVGALLGTDAHVAGWVAGRLPGFPADVYPTVGALALFCGPVPLAVYAAYRGGDDVTRGSPAGFARGYALVVGPATFVTLLSPAIPDGWWLVVGVFLVGLVLATLSPLFVRRIVAHRPLTAAEARGLSALDLPVYVLETGGGGGPSATRGPANALAAGVLPGLRCVFVTERLVATLAPDELAAIIAHEVGHHRRRHVPLRLCAVATFVLPWLGATALEIPGAFLAGLVLALPATLAVFRLVRWTEYDADAYAARRVGPGAMARALRGLGPEADGPRFTRPFALHPPLDRRVARLDPLDESGPHGPGRTPRYPH